MKKIILAALVLSSTAYAQQQKTYDLKGLTVEETNTTMNQLGKLPWSEVNPLMQKLIPQINAQSQPAPIVVPPVETPKE